MAVATSTSGALQNLQDMGLFLLRSLDSSKKLIDQIIPAADGATIKYKTGTTLPLKVAASLAPTIFCNGYVIVRNTKENVQVIIDHWQEALTFEKLVIIFLDERSGNRWLLRPSIHAKIAEPKTLAQGLLTLYEHSMEKA